MNSAAASEIEKGERFAFGANWTRFLSSLTDERMDEAERSLREMLQVQTLDGVRFLDVGSGSGLFSLAACRLGATVRSFDYDTESVACALELKRRFFHDSPRWTIEQGSVLDKTYLAGLGQYDVVYSWGVLHHTGAMWQAMDNVSHCVKEGGLLFISIYNDQGNASRRWSRIKRAYNEHRLLRPVLLGYGVCRGWGLPVLRDFYRLRPFETWRTYHKARGMSPWWDVVDWIGGWPFEVATPEAVFHFYRERGFILENLVTRQGIACNEFVFRRT